MYHPPGPTPNHHIPAGHDFRAGIDVANNNDVPRVTNRVTGSQRMMNEDRLIALQIRFDRLKLGILIEAVPREIEGQPQIHTGSPRLLRCRQNRGQRDLPLIERVPESTQLGGAERPIGQLEGDPGATKKRRPFVNCLE